jgi:DNA invertase Pin-like site-specific DNA recombinase
VEDRRVPRLIGYVRVSTDAQAERGLGLAVQERSLRSWVSKHGHRLVGITRDEGVSGALAGGERPGRMEALSAVERRRADGLVVARLDRLARTLAVQEAALGHVWCCGGRVFATDAGEVLHDDPDDPMRTAMRQIVGVFGQLERGTIAARLRAARRLKEERGGYAGRGSPRFGQRAESGELVADAAEEATIRRILDLAESGTSLRGICQVLHDAGLPAKRGGEWRPAPVSRVLTRHRQSQVC